jgi:hypothetical protein
MTARDLTTTDRPTGGATGRKETRPNWASAQYVSNPSTKPVPPSPKPWKPSTTIGSSASAPSRNAKPGSSASGITVSDPVLDEVLNGRSVMEHLKVFRISNEELKISRRVVEG